MKFGYARVSTHEQTHDLLGFVNALNAQGFQFVSLTEQMNTTTTMGRLVFQIFGALAEYERGLIRERARRRPGPGGAWADHPG